MFIVESNTFFNFSCFDGNDDLDNPIQPVITGTDISNQIFTNRSSDCADYVDTYQATVNDIQRSISFQAEVTVSDDGSSCTLTSNNIPNHDFNDSSARNLAV